MKIFWSKVLVLACLVTTSFALYAQNKTVVIPLGSDEAPTSYWAVVGSDGTLVRGSSGTTST